ncbi:hypothetical protein E4U21_002782 [Claviceps maximensis]|nr:hypothetical protein E4U21_002782 [Claviceps maximensis]
MSNIMCSRGKKLTIGDAWILSHFSTGFEWMSDGELRTQQAIVKAFAGRFAYLKNERRKPMLRALVE